MLLCKRNFSLRPVAPSGDSRSTNKRHASSNSCTQKIRDGLQETKTFQLQTAPKTAMDRKRNFAKTKIPKTKVSRTWQICSFGAENENEIRSVSNIDTKFPLFIPSKDEILVQKTLTSLHERKTG